jgi:hypothetical protein
VEGYLERGLCDDFEAKLKQVSELESKGDTLRRSIEAQLYEQTLIPDLRGDVLSLLEDLDTLMGNAQGNLYRFSIQTPEIPEEFHADIVALTKTVVTCVESVLLAARAFFRNIEAVRDHNHKVVFLETEADKLSSKLGRAIFSSALPLDRKIHLHYFIEHIDDMANTAEDIADCLAIYTIKRSI